LAFKNVSENINESKNEAKNDTYSEYLLVDGYNIIFAWPFLENLTGESMDLARNALCNILCNYRAFKQIEVIVVFDAYKVDGSLGSVEKFNNITVIYTKEAETADMYIEKVTKKIGDKRKVRVATSDGLEQSIILGHGALRLPASVFLEEIIDVENKIREF
jgi:ribosomal protection tetracycline resistance protein